MGRSRGGAAPLRVELAALRAARVRALEAAVAALPARLAAIPGGTGVEAPGPEGSEGKVMG